jgi:hypothetical protein
VEFWDRERRLKNEKSEGKVSVEVYTKADIAKLHVSSFSAVRANAKKIRARKPSAIFSDVDKRRKWKIFRRKVKARRL